MSKISNSPKVKVRYVHRVNKNAFVPPSGIDVEFEIGWSHTDGHDKFGKELCALLDSMHEVHSKWCQVDKS